MLFAKEKSDVNKITEYQLMKFEFEHNMNEIKWSIKQAESRKNLLEKEAELIINTDREEAKYKLKQSLLFECLMIKLQSSWKSIEDQYKMLLKLSTSIPIQTFQLIVLKSRDDLLNYDDWSRFIFDPDSVNLIPDIKLEWIENDLRKVEEDIENLIQDYLDSDLKSSKNFQSLMQTYKVDNLESLADSNKENKAIDSESDYDEFNFRASNALSTSDYRGSIAIKLDED